MLETCHKNCLGARILFFYVFNTRISHLYWDYYFMKYFLFTQKTLLLNIKYSNGEDNRYIDYNSVRDLAWGEGALEN